MKKKKSQRGAPGASAHTPGFPSREELLEAFSAQSRPMRVDGLLRVLGLARRARLLEIGEEPVGIVCRSGKAKLLLVAKDAGDHTFRRARSFVSGSKCPYVCVPYTKDELGDGLGCNACALCAFTEPAFAKSFLEALGDETHADILAQLTVQTQRVQKRRQEAQAHRKNVKMGKK